LAEAVAAVEAVVVVPVAAVVVGRVAWGVPRRPGQAATACVPIVVTRCLTRWDSHAIR
jgi:hypothetical protein